MVKTSIAQQPYCLVLVTNATISVAPATCSRSEPEEPALGFIARGSPGPAVEASMFVQMRSPFTGKWLRVDADDGAIVESAQAAWPGIPHLPRVLLPPPEVPRPQAS